MCLDHFGQVMKAKKFQHFDYGTRGNKDHYGQEQPPELNLKAADGKVPVGLFVGDGDELADVIDVNWIPTQIPNSIKFHKVYHYGHLSFMVGKDMQYLYDVKDMLETYHPLRSTLESE